MLSFLFFKFFTLQAPGCVVCLYEIYNDLTSFDVPFSVY